MVDMSALLGLPSISQLHASERFTTFPFFVMSLSLALITPSSGNLNIIRTSTVYIRQEMPEVVASHSFWVGMVGF